MDDFLFVGVFLAAAVVTTVVVTVDGEDRVLDGVRARVVAVVVVTLVFLVDVDAGAADSVAVDLRLAEVDFVLERERDLVEADDMADARIAEAELIVCYSDKQLLSCGSCARVVEERCR